MIMNHDHDDKDDDHHHLQHRRTEDMTLNTRCVASQSLSSTHRAAETSLIQGVFLVFLCSVSSIFM